MKDLLWKLGGVAIVLAVCAFAIFPPKERLKLGKDLAGGTTLTYGILPDAETGKPPTQDEVQQIISVILDRINPKGIYDISIVAVGTNQIEISMPSPTPEVRQLRQDFQSRLTVLGETTIVPSDVDELVRLDGSTRSGRLTELSREAADRLPLLETAISTFDAMQSANSEYERQYAEHDQLIEPLLTMKDTAQDAHSDAIDGATVVGLDRDRLNEIVNSNSDLARNTSIESLITDVVKEGIEEVAARNAIDLVVSTYEAIVLAEDQLSEAEENWNRQLIGPETTAANAELAYEEARRAVIDTSLNTDELVRVLGLDQTPVNTKDPKTKQWVSGPSPREKAVTRLTTKYALFADSINDIQQSYDAYKSKAKGYDDPKELIALLRGAGVLEFRISASVDDPLPPIETLRAELQDRGPRHLESTNEVRWFPIDKLDRWYDKPEQYEYLMADPYNFMRSKWKVICDNFDGQIYMLLYDTPGRALTEASGNWKVSRAFPKQDQMGMPAVGFDLDASGSQKFGLLTGNNISRGMAIVLDDRVFTAPTIQSRITGNGQITGRFSQKEVTYLLKVLNSGALQAKLTREPIAQQTIGPKLGLDNLHRGMNAGIVALIIVGIFMMIYYFFSGMVANVALLCNAIIILGVMSLYQAAFTMPGIAGIVLTFGMAVDANVLIYERIREELETGVDLRTAIRLGYEKVLSTIIDANVTNLIVCFVLGMTATTEVKGFALTLGIGIVATLFSALIVTRLIFELYCRVFEAESLPMLPSVFRGLNRFLHPNISWVNLRVPVWIGSGIIVVAALLLTSVTWKEMLDTEFLGGTSVSFTFKNDETTDQPITLARADVEQRIKDYALQAHDTGSFVEQQEHSTAAYEAAFREALADGIDEISLQGVVDAVEPPEQNTLITELVTRMKAGGSINEPVVRETIGNVVALHQDLTQAEQDLADLVALSSAAVYNLNADQIEGEDFRSSAYVIKSTVTNTKVLEQAIIDEFGSILDLKQPIHFTDWDIESANGAPIFPILDGNLGEVISESTVTNDVRGFLGGAAIVLRDLTPTSSVEEIEERINRLRQTPEFDKYFGRQVKVIGLTRAEGQDSDGRDLWSDAVIVVGAGDTDIYQRPDEWDVLVRAKEWEIARRALTEPASLDQVTTISAAIASQFRAKAIVAIFLSLVGILAYIWVRFGSLRYSLAAIIALVHDVCVTLGLLAATHYVFNTFIGQALYIEAFKIDLGVIAALLTIIGYSLNDTIVILDRIRENRGKLAVTSRDVVNRSINQTFSRTMLTSGTTLLAVLIMYSQGGTGIRPFTFAMLCGVLVGTYSSIGIAAPMVYKAMGVDRLKTEEMTEVDEVAE